MVIKDKSQLSDLVCNGGMVSYSFLCIVYAYFAGGVMEAMGCYVENSGDRDFSTLLVSHDHYGLNQEFCGGLCRAAGY